MKQVLEVFLTSLRMGVTAFGGPVAHIGYFREEYVNKRQWLSEERYAELMAITQFLPGPGSSQLGAAVGYERAGWLGGLAAWIGFTLPSALVMILFAIGISSLAPDQLDWIKGLSIAALGVVLHAVVGMQGNLCGKEWKTNLIAVCAFVGLWFVYEAWMQPAVIFLGAILGFVFFRGEKKAVEMNRFKWRKSVLAFVVVALVAGIPFLFVGDQKIIGGIFKAGSLVFGGGHVVLPMLSSQVVDTQLMDQQSFTAGYGMTQAMPGPVFTFGGYIGAKLGLLGNAWLGGIVGVVAIFLPGMLLMSGFVPVWDSLKSRSWAKSAMRGANASVVGLLAVAFCKLVVSSQLGQWWEWVLVAVCFCLLKWKVLPSWALVLGFAGIGYLVY